MPIFKINTPTKDGRSYYFKYYYKDVFGASKRYSSKRYKTKREAEIAEAEFIIKCGNVTDNFSITVEEAYMDLMIHKRKILKPQSIRRDKCLFHNLSPLHKTKINDLNLSVYNAYINYLDKKKLSIDYKNKIIGLLSQIIKHSAKYYNTNDKLIKYIEKYRDINIKRETEFFTYDEFKQFSSVIDDPEYQRFFDMLYYLGLRQGELTALTFDDIDFNLKQIRINKTLTTKVKGELYYISTPKTNASNRILPLSDKLIADIKEQLNLYKKYKDFKSNWFIFGGNVPFRESTIQAHKNNYCKLAGVKQIRIHDFRHSCASLLINNGASVVLVSKWLGHSKISMTLNTYTHLYKSELNSISELINTL